MAIDLPTVDRLAVSEPYLIDSGVEQRGELGGQDRRFTRLGSRWGIDIKYPPMDATCGRALIAAMVKARTEGQMVRVPLPIAPQTAAFGSLLVNGGSQLGTSLIVDGGAGSATVPKGYFFSNIISGRSYLYMTTADTVLSGGAGTLTIGPMLRKSPTDNAALTFSAPVLEGFLPGDVLRWNLEDLSFYGATLSLREAA